MVHRLRWGSALPERCGYLGKRYSQWWTCGFGEGLLNPAYCITQSSKKASMDGYRSGGARGWKGTAQCGLAPAVDGTKVGLSVEVLHLSLAFQMGRILSFSSFRSTFVALKSSNESRHRASLNTPCMTSQIRSSLKSLAPTKSHNVGLPFLSTWATMPCEILWASASTWWMSHLESQFFSWCWWALSEAFSSTRAQRKSYITTSLRCCSPSLAILSVTFWAINHWWILALDGLPSVKSLRSNVPPWALHWSTRASRVVRLPNLVSTM